LSSFDLSRFPAESGVYLMKDASEKVIYVGKAKNLKLRVKQYFHPGRDERPMIPFLVQEISSIDTIVVPNEKEALLLENTLIKKYQPKYNALLKDDKTFISLMINHKHPWPMVRLIRYKGKSPKDGLYFGPYTSALAARHTFDLMTRLFPLRQCSDSELKRRSRPCLLYSIGRCIAPCVGKCTPDEYQTFVQGAIDFLKGNDQKILKELSAAMELASQTLEYEKANALLKTIQQIQHVTQGGGLVARSGGKDTDALSVARQGKEAIVIQLIFREGHLIGSEKYTFKGTAESDEDLLASLILQLYKNQKTLPHEILTPLELPKPLSEIVGCHIYTAKKGEKKRLTDLAHRNALAEFAKSSSEEKLLLELQEQLHLSRYPQRIECFDTSNISGTDIVAAMVAFTNGLKDRKRTRLFKIRTVEKGDDYAALKEALTRRLKRAKEENDLPDLIVIDGGKGQLGITLSVLKELDIATCDAIAVTKESAKHTKGMTREKVFLPHTPEPLLLSDRSPLLFFLQKVRDETHEKAILFHRKKRSQRTIQTALSAIPGIGPIKQKRLLQHFGSLARIRAASDAELSAIKGITQKDIAAIRSSTGG